MSLRKITPAEFIAFVQRHPGRYRTVAENTEFVAKPFEDCVIFLIRHGHRTERLDRVRLRRYVAVFNRNLDYNTGSYRRFFLKSYFLGVVRQIQLRGPATGNLLNRLNQEELEILTAKKTERKELRKSRIGQGLFRRRVIRLREQCLISEMTEKEFLRASHIKPWSESSNQERLDPHNGLLFAPNYDHLFDSAYISFRDDGRIMISPRLKRKILDTFRLDPDFRAPAFDAATKRYLKHHRARFRKKAEA